jgi:hypothetical protein
VSGELGSEGRTDSGETEVATGSGFGIYKPVRIHADLNLGVVVTANSPGYDLDAAITPMVESKD